MNKKIIIPSTSLLSLLLLFFFVNAQVEVHPDSQFKLNDYNTYITLSYVQSFTKIQVEGDKVWFDNHWVSVDDADMTITDWFKTQDSTLEFSVRSTIGTNSLIRFYCNDKGEPVGISVNGNPFTDWTYDGATRVLTLPLYHSSSAMDVSIEFGEVTPPTAPSCQELLDLVASKYGCFCCKECYDPVADVNKDRDINMDDTALVAKNKQNEAWCQDALNKDDDPCPSSCLSLLSLVQSKLGTTCDTGWSYDTIITDVNKDGEVNGIDSGLVLQNCKDGTWCRKRLINDNDACCPGDVNYDRKVDIKDLATIAKAYGSYAHPNWNPHADVNNDLKVDDTDVNIVTAAFGSYPGHPKWNPAADVNKDGSVDQKDTGIVGAAYGSYAHPKWNPILDITGPEYLVPDSKVDIRDLALAAKNFGLICVPLTFTIELGSGWNPVSSPIREGIEVQAIEAVCGDAEVLQWDGRTYKPGGARLQPGKGYRVLVLTDCSLTVTGTPYPFQPIELAAGESYLIGASFKPLRLVDILGTCDPYKLDVKVYDRDTESLIPADTLEPGKSYWITSDVDCTFGRETTTGLELISSVFNILVIIIALVILLWILFGFKFFAKRK